MKMGDLKIGRSVLIKKIDITDKHFDSNNSMKEMIGRIKSITKIEISDPVMVSLDDDKYIWHIDDLETVNPIEHKEELFDPNNLI